MGDGAKLPNLHIPPASSRSSPSFDPPRKTPHSHSDISPSCRPAKLTCLLDDTMRALVGYRPPHQAACSQSFSDAPLQLGDVDMLRLAASREEFRASHYCGTARPARRTESPAAAQSSLSCVASSRSSTRGAEALPKVGGHATACTGIYLYL